MAYLFLLLRYKGSKNDHSLIFKLFNFSNYFGGFFLNDSFWKMQHNLLQVFFVEFAIFFKNGAKGFKKCDFAGDKKFLFFIRFEWVFSFDSSQWELSIVCQRILPFSS